MLNTLSTTHRPLALYIHWPFCKSKCPYCDFNSHVQAHIDYDEWLRAYITELQYYQEHIAQHTITSIFFGGGTPSLMPASLVHSLLDHIHTYYRVADDCEITLEANPTSVESKTFADFYQAGINRFSLGIQSLHDDDLHFLGREHSSAEAMKAIERAAKCTNNYSFDLIYARPHQTLQDWGAELEQALSLACNHLSLYQLTIEKGTPFYSAYYKDHAFSLPHDDAATDLYDTTNHIMQQHGFNLYEISNYAKPGFACKHNLAYWRYQPYLGIGPGAHSRIKLHNQLHALMTIHHPQHWLSSVATKQHGLQTTQALTDSDIAQEILITGLRLQEGIPLNRFTHECGKPYDYYLDSHAIAMLEQEGFLTLTHETLVLTDRGRMMLDSVIEKLVKVCFTET